MAAPISPYGWSKLMTGIILRDAATAHDLRYCILRYFNVAAPIPSAAPGSRQEAALGLRPKLDISCIRDYIHVSDLVRAHSDALRYLRAGSASVTLNCGYGHGF